jgi:Amt family ammonium transporter
VPSTVKGILYGDPSQLVAQIIGPIVNFCFIFGASWAFFKVCDLVFGMRVSAEVELEGLDVPEMGAHGYPEVQGPATLVHAMGASSVRAPGAAAMTPERAR